MAPKTKVFSNAKPSGPTLDDVAELIREKKAKNIIVLVGAGISTSAGIPDFRSPETGLYANLAKYDLPYPEAIFDLSYFYERPEAFFTLAKELYPGNYLPTLTHYFFVLLHRKGVLRRLFSQNVDTLERIAGLPDEAIVEAHGSFASAKCMKCRQAFMAEELRPRIAKGEVLRCDEKGCKGHPRALIKSDIVFFGEALPELFFKRMGDFSKCDLLITIGTSLAVHPFASLIDRVDDDCPRVLINLESVGEMDEFDASDEDGRGMYGSYREEGFDFEGATRGGKEFARDVRWLGPADEGIKELAKALAWEAELFELHESGHKTLKLKDLTTRDSPTTSEAGDDEPLEAAKEEAEKVTAEIADKVSHEPSQQDKSAAETLHAEDDKKFDELAQDLEKLDVVSKDDAPGTKATAGEAAPAQGNGSDGKAKKSTL